MASVKGQPAPKPGSVKNPIPTQKSAVDDFFADFDAPEVDAPIAEAGAEESFAPVEQPQQEPEEAPGLGGQVLDAAGRVLDYAGGAMRAGLANSAGMIQDVAQGKNPLNEPPIVTEEDLKNVLKGKGPDSAEYLRRLGVPEGGSLNFGGVKVTTRGAAGFASDVATDPLTQVVKLAKQIPYLKKLINAESKTGLINKASEALGEAIYKSSLPRGAEEAAEVLVKNGAPVGGSAKLAQRVEEMSNTIGKLRQGLYDKASELGVTIDTAFPLKRAEAVLSQMGKDPGLEPAARELAALIARYKQAGKVSIDMVSEWKTNLYDALPATAFNGAKLKGNAKRFKAALAADFREAIVQAGNKAEKGLGDSINALNEKWGALLSATRPLEKATTATGGKLGLIIDGAVAAGGGPKAYAVKKGFDLATGTAARTLAGRALMEAGKHDLASRLARQSFAATQRPSPLQPEEEEIPQE